MLDGRPVGGRRRERRARLDVEDPLDDARPDPDARRGRRGRRTRTRRAHRAPPGLARRHAERRRGAVPRVAEVDRRDRHAVVVRVPDGHVRPGRREDEQVADLGDPGGRGVRRPCPGSGARRRPSRPVGRTATPSSSIQPTRFCGPADREQRLLQLRRTTSAWAGSARRPAIAPSIERADAVDLHVAERVGGQVPREPALRRRGERRGARRQRRRVGDRSGPPRRRARRRSTRRPTIIHGASSASPVSAWPIEPSSWTSRLEARLLSTKTEAS